MKSLERVELLTNTFFDMHWPTGLERPRWKSDWEWKGSVPHHDKGGVYALINKDSEVIYIGLGASRGGAPYEGFGIARRLLSHVITTDKEKGRGHYKPKSRWLNVLKVAAIGFPPEYTYLASALEGYLIREVKPSENNLKKT